ncbi:MAG: sugar ABC transporter permease [Firmicutes bacterium]|nr:sugar ABC transporter permease [Bacillota bacterium]
MNRPTNLESYSRYGSNMTNRASRRRSLEAQRQAFAYFLITPAVLMLIVFMVYPLFNALVLSLYQWNGFGSKIFIGFENFVGLFRDPRFFNALGNTLKYTVGSVFGTLLIGFLTALALHIKIKGWRFFRTAFFMNVILSITAVGILWGNLLHPIGGPVKLVLKLVGITAPDWFGNPSLVMWVITAINIWQYSGYPMLFLFTAMESIPTEMYEAAEIDGITFWKKVWYLILPMIKPVLAIVTMLQVINSFKVFDVVFVITKGGPGQASEVLSLYMYNVAFWFRRFGYGSAISVIMLMLEMILAWFYLRAVRFEQAPDEG